MAQVEGIPLCKECSHFRFVTWEPVFAPGQRTSTIGRSLHPPQYRCLAMTGMPNPIDGDPIVHSDCGMMRLGCDCGREGKLFKPKGGEQ